MRLRQAGLLALAALALPASSLAAQGPAVDPVSCRVRDPNRPADAREAALAAVNDSAAAIVREAARAAGIDSARGLVYIRPGVGVEVHGGNLPPGALNGVSTRLLDLALDQPQGPRRDLHPTLFVRLDPLPLPPCGPRPRREMRPRLLNPGQAVSLLQSLVRRYNPSPTAAERLNLKMLLTRDGEAVGAEVIDSNSHRTWEDGVLELASRLRFSAATLDRVPQDVVIVLPVILESREAPPGGPRAP